MKGRDDLRDYPWTAGVGDGVKAREVCNKIGLK